MPGAAVIAVDWGTTNRRVLLLDAAGTVLAVNPDARGVLSGNVTDYVAEIADLRARLGDLPVIAAGMVGSSRGWREVPYVAAPAGLADLARGMVEVADRVTIVPGVSLVDGMASEVMRGEEVQVLGAVAAGLAPQTALFCQPGTHSKWVRVEDARITGCTTAMTGELFGLLRRDSVLAEMLAGDISPGRAFREGVERGKGASDLTVALFRIRAACLLGELDQTDAPSFASGLLIGAETGAQGNLAGREVHLISGGALGELYAAAIEAAGGTPVRIDDTNAFAAGIANMREAAPCA